ncbi:hypothetical protein M885DRAFT_542287 [Pelagophyceae sp. CCMP2097]|nr:hypothetical protein M885DRAFT_544126 [Pelagophyceae sp. CCMP2097]KAJ1447595.1 hypothetical protein M885DRAFT_542287 [Pelagophyceae sp. CCMP2097]
MQTPFGGDGACVAAALLCEAHESSDGLLLDDESMDAEWVKLLVSLSNLSQLYRLQHARWDAEGESLWGGGSFDPDGEDTPEAAPLVYADGDDEHRLFAHRLPSTHADNLQHMLVAIASDFRALPLLLVRRLRALRDEIATAAAAEPDAAEKPSSLARDALDVLAPLAERFGLYKLKSDLEDAAFERLAPATRRRILGHLDVRRDERHVVLEDVSMRLRRLLKEDDVLQNGVASLRVSVREKEPYSVWRKQHVAKKRRTADDGEALDEGATPLDTIAFRVVLDPDAPAEAEALCYHALKLVQQTWQPIKDRTKDYVANPKPNGYQSIHTTSLMRLHGQTYPFEVQIRTRSMHLVAEFGSAAHALYSKGKDEDVKDGAAAAAAAPALAEVAPVSGFAWPTVPGVSRAAPAVSLEAMQLQAADDSLWSRRLDVRLKRRHADGHDSALGASLGASLGAKLRSERVFVLARGGRVLTVASQSDAFDVRRALMNDLEMDAGRRGAGYAAQHRNYGGHLAINGRRVEWLQSLETKLLNGDEISWSS